MTMLPTFKGFTVDYRLQEFRRVVYGEMPLYVPFDSPAGQDLLREMREQKEKGK